MSRLLRIEETVPVLVKTRQPVSAQPIFPNVCATNERRHPRIVVGGDGVRGCEVRRAEGGGGGRGWGEVGVSRPANHTSPRMVARYLSIKNGPRHGPHGGRTIPSPRCNLGRLATALGSLMGFVVRQQFVHASRRAAGAPIAALGVSAFGRAFSVRSGSPQPPRIVTGNQRPHHRPSASAPRGPSNPQPQVEPGAPSAPRWAAGG